MRILLVCYLQRPEGAPSAVSCARVVSRPSWAWQGSLSSIKCGCDPAGGKLWYYFVPSLHWDPKTTISSRQHLRSICCVPNTVSTALFIVLINSDYLPIRRCHSFPIAQGKKLRIVIMAEPEFKSIPVWCQSLSSYTQARKEQKTPYLSSQRGSLTNKSAFMWT